MASREQRQKNGLTECLLTIASQWTTLLSFGPRRAQKTKRYCSPFKGFLKEAKNVTRLWRPSIRL